MCVGGQANWVEIGMTSHSLLSHTSYHTSLTLWSHASTLVLTAYGPKWCILNPHSSLSTVGSTLFGDHSVLPLFSVIWSLYRSISATTKVLQAVTGKKVKKDVDLFLPPAPGELLKTTKKLWLSRSSLKNTPEWQWFASHSFSWSWRWLSKCKQTWHSIYCSPHHVTLQ